LTIPTPNLFALPSSPIDNILLLGFFLDDRE
jgi:hypothetical protein